MTPKQRYLMYISYLGSTFRGSQIQNRLGVFNAEVTVQGTIETSLGYCLGIPGDRAVRVYLASRTDSGVHALKSAVHFDLPPIRGNFTQPEIIHNLLNKHFSKTETQLRILEVLKVPEVFSARHSILERVYMYRLGILKDEFLTHKGSPNSVTPITELQRTFFPRIGQFHLKKAEEVAQLFVGEKNFENFVGKPSKNIASTTCKINSVFIQKTEPLMPIEPLVENYDFYHVIFKGSRFLRYMVRRMVGVILSVAVNKTTVDEAKNLIDAPEKERWMSKIIIPPGYGLYLVNIVYNPEHLTMTEAEEKDKKQSLSLLNEIVTKNISES